MRALMIGPDERSALVGLRERAAAAPVDMDGLAKRLKLPKLKARHMRQMTAQTVYLPVGYAVTFSVERNHPFGRTARHMSMSVEVADRMPHPAALWMVAEELGFTGRLADVDGMWIENLKGHGLAVNIVQLVGVAAEGHA